MNYRNVCPMIGVIDWPLRGELNRGDPLRVSWACLGQDSALPSIVYRQKAPREGKWELIFAAIGYSGM